MAGGSGEMSDKGYKLSFIGWINSGNLIYNIVTMANNIIYLKVTEKVNLTYSHCRKRNSNYVTGWQYVANGGNKCIKTCCMP